MQKQVRAIRLILLIPLLATPVSCGAELQEKVAGLYLAVAELSTDNKAQKHQIDDLKADLNTYKLTNDFVIMKISSRVECEDTKVRDFLKECEQGAEVCSSAQGLSNAFKWFATQPYVRLLCRPGSGVKGLPSTRDGQLLTLTEINSLKPATRFLILVTPRSDSEIHRKEATVLGREVHQLLRDEYHLPDKTPIIGPRILPCNMKRDSTSRYAREVDKPVKGEPSENEPQLKVHVFRTEC